MREWVSDSSGDATGVAGGDVTTEVVDDDDVTGTSRPPPVRMSTSAVTGPASGGDTPAHMPSAVEKVGRWKDQRKW